jgi:hypothetical protein
MLIVVAAAGWRTVWAMTPDAVVTAALAISNAMYVRVFAAAAR